MGNQVVVMPVTSEGIVDGGDVFVSLATATSATGTSATGTSATAKIRKDAQRGGFYNPSLYADKCFLTIGKPK